MIRRLVAVVAAIVLLSAELTAAATPIAITREDQRDVAVTIYNGNLGLVKDLREVRLPGGTHEVEFRDVAAQIDPTSVHLRSLTAPGGLRVLEQNYEYDLLSSQKLMEKYVGRKVRLYAGDGTYHEATLLSVNGPVGEDWIDHTPKDERVKIKLGHAFDVVADRTQKDWRKLGSSLYEVEWEISLRNHKDATQTVTVIEPVPGDWQVLQSTHAWEKIESHTLRFRVPVKKDANEKIVYRVRIRY